MRAVILFVLFVGLAGCAQLRLPQIDPLGRGVFLPPPNSTTIVRPGQNVGLGVPQPWNYPAAQPQYAQPQFVQPGLVQAPVYQPPAQPMAIQPIIPSTPAVAMQPAPVRSGPAFTHPPATQGCANGGCAALGRPSLHSGGSLISHKKKHHNSKKKRGTLLTTPARIVAPVGSEVVVLAGICGGDGYYVMNQPIEWMLSRDSSGQIVEVGGMNHSVFNQLVKPSSKKFDGEYAWGRTGLKPHVITRGTDTPFDDIEVNKGQTWISLSSASEGTSYLTCVAPKSEAWPERKSITRIHWVDGIWSIPMPTSATAGTIHPLAVQVNRSSDGSGVEGWKVNYQIVGGVPAEFHPNGTQSATVPTNTLGQAPIEIRQPAGKAVAGPTQVRVQVVRPGYGGGREVVLESGITTVNWSSPALTIRAIGPRTAGINQPFNYRIEVTNPGDQVARGVKVSTEDISDNVEYISSDPKPTEYGNRYEWDLGDIQPGAQPKIIDVQMRAKAEGSKNLCFEVASQTDQLSTEACAETDFSVPCFGLVINGPKQGRVGENLPFTFDLTNNCDRPLENVTVRLQHDAGLTADGVPNPVDLTPIARLMPGETVNLPALNFRAIQGGTHCFDLFIRSAAGDDVEAKRCIVIENVTESKVRVEMESQRVVKVGEQAFVQITVTNVGNVPLDNVDLINRFSRSLNAVERTALPQDWVGDDMRFRLGRLEPNESRTVEIRYDTNRVDGDAFSRAIVTTPLGASDQTGVTIRIEPANGFDGGAGGQGEPGIQVPIDRGQPGGGIGGAAAGTGIDVQVVALDQTVAVNNNANFQVSVTNRFGVIDENVVITLLIPPGTRLDGLELSQTGLSIAEQSADGSQIRLVPRQVLRDGESITFPITLQTLQAGQATFAVQVTSARQPDAVEGRDAVRIDP